MTERTFMVYGANGFTGKLIAERAKATGLMPILAGRSAESVGSVARRLDLPYRVFALEDPEATRAGIRAAALVLHCAGPFSATSRPMVDACLAEGVHYLDITGEYGVLEAVFHRDEEARSAKVVLLPAVGFDVVPTDCMAQSLKQALPDAVSLELAFSGGMQPSPGTAKTAVEGLHVGALVRRDGRLTTLKAPLTREIPFARRAQHGMSIPWGDLVTAHRSTGIPNITVYTVVPKAVARLAPLLRFGAPLLESKSVIGFLKRRVETRAKGPSSEERQTARMSVWGRAENASGRAVEGQLEIPEGYEFTVVSALASVERVLRGEVDPGATTPSRAFGADFVSTLPGAGPIRVS